MSNESQLNITGTSYSGYMFDGSEFQFSTRVDNDRELTKMFQNQGHKEPIVELITIYIEDKNIMKYFEMLFENSDINEASSCNIIDMLIHYKNHKIIDKMLDKLISIKPNQMRRIINAFLEII